MRVGVLLCDGLASLAPELDLPGLCSSLEATCPGAVVEVLPELCTRPDHLPRLVARRPFERAVLGLCSSDYPQAELQTQARKAGLDPFGLEVVPLGTLCVEVHPAHQAIWKAEVLLRGAVAKALAYQGSGIEHSKLIFLPLTQKVRRRSLFTLPPIIYRPVPAIRRGRCLAERGCELCLRACPRDALRSSGEGISLDKRSCEGCGVCLTVCPRGAIDFPGWSLPQIEAQLTSLLSSTGRDEEASGVLFICQRHVSTLEGLARRGVFYSHRWLPLILPCLGMVTPHRIFQALASGAGEIGLLCDTECPFGQQQIVSGRVDFCRQLLRLLEQPSERVKAVSPPHLEEFLRRPPQGAHCWRVEGADRGLGTPEGLLAAIRHLAAGDASAQVFLEHSYSPFGVLVLQPERCTGCISCVEACPTGALTSEEEEGLGIIYSPILCTGCGLCVMACPEAALTVHRATRLDILGQGRIEIYKAGLARCVKCGAAFAPLALLQRIQAVLGENEALSLALNRYCPSCRSPYAWAEDASPPLD